ncbi:caspase family protein [Desulfobotulus mexicanus]|uniref:Caspase family protein n=1 Tax=Desulfobotulus mexicanus TaxID=2586642 RepID=A0A5S5MFD1_9BACT|nr:caspase family protein [Desulfobotulus mexicanus]TYT74389.1 caspase family protein [Desulfobotulus mexicanus]
MNRGADYVSTTIGHYRETVRLAMNIENIFAVIIGIEDYSYSKAPHDMKGVDFARNDAIAFQDCIKEVFGITDDNIQIWLDSDANRTRIENDLPYFIQGLRADDTLIFYYAGHGFHKEGENRITAWDTHPNNLSNTTISLSEILFEPLKKSNCKKALVFIDACSTFLNDILPSRDVISNMTTSEFEQFIQSKDHTALYLASSPGQPSFPSTTLQHGIWTYHLIEALKGNAKMALTRDEWITDVSLKDYLSFAIPEYIREKTTISKQQQPYAIISAGHTFEIVRIKRNEESFNWEKFNLDIKEAYLRNEDSAPIKYLPGFQKKKGHFIPDNHSSKVSEFIQRLLTEDIKSESKIVYDRAKSILGLKRKEISRDTYEGSANVDCDLFRMEWDSEQNPLDPSEYLLSRIVKLRVPPSQLPNDFDDIFPVKPDEFVIPIRGEMEFDYIADQFEDLSEQIDGTFEEDEDSGLISLTSNEGTQFVVNLELNEFIIIPNNGSGCLQLLNTVSSEMGKLLEFTSNSFLIE